MKSRSSSKAYRGESLFSFFKKDAQDDGNESLNKNIPCNNDVSLKNEPKVPRVQSQVPTSKAEYDRNSVINKKCPFYKWIPGTKLTVDAFNNGMIDGCEGYLLSHFHYDHYRGLSGKFQGLIFCSNTTKGLIHCAFGAQLNVIPMKLNVKMDICGVHVMAIDANHCPGSVMFLFHISSRKQFILHTGDFRFSIDMLTIPSPLAEFRADLLGGAQPAHSIHTVFLDTTYCNPTYDFPIQERVIDSAIEISRQHLKKDTSTLVICGMYSIGKERFVYGLADALNISVWLPKTQRRLIQTAATHGCKLCASLIKRTVTSPTQAQLHVLSMAQVNLSYLTQYQSQLGPTNHVTPFNRSQVGRKRSILAWRPTGWSHRSRSSQAIDKNVQITLDGTNQRGEGVILERSNSSIRVYGAAYSEHSSATELETFIKALHPTRVQPTVFGGGLEKLREQIATWLKPGKTVASLTACS